MGSTWRLEAPTALCGCGSWTPVCAGTYGTCRPPVGDRSAGSRTWRGTQTLRRRCWWRWPTSQWCLSPRALATRTARSSRRHSWRRWRLSPPPPTPRWWLARTRTRRGPTRRVRRRAGRRHRCTRGTSSLRRTRRVKRLLRRAGTGPWWVPGWSCVCLRRWGTRLGTTRETTWQCSHPMCRLAAACLCTSCPRARRSSPSPSPPARCRRCPSTPRGPSSSW
mmetsp:Transcript_4117/g.9238  ORF Transcript_4117/g.9238 Transcript_4117/m.9238 type:complete len:221 (-) Transcript_4117:533-1195(-)